MLGQFMDVPNGIVLVLKSELITCYLRLLQIQWSSAWVGEAPKMIFVSSVFYCCTHNWSLTTTFVPSKVAVNNSLLEPWVISRWPELFQVVFFCRWLKIWIRLLLLMLVIAFSTWSHLWADFFLSPPTFFSTVLNFI